MSRGDIIATQLIRPLCQHAELERGIAHHTGIRRTPGKIFIHKITDHDVLKGRPLVGYVMGDTQTSGQSPGILYEIGIFLSRIGKLAWQIPHAHRHAHHFVAFVQQHQAHRRTVDATRHADQYLLSFMFHIC